MRESGLMMMDFMNVTGRMSSLQGNPLRVLPSRTPSISYYSVDPLFTSATRSCQRSAQAKRQSEGKPHAFERGKRLDALGKALIRIQQVEVRPDDILTVRRGVQEARQVRRIRAAGDGAVRGGPVVGAVHGPDNAALLVLRAGEDGVARAVDVLALEDILREAVVEAVGRVILHVVAAVCELREFDCGGF